AAPSERQMPGAHRQPAQIGVDSTDRGTAYRLAREPAAGVLAERGAERLVMAGLLSCDQDLLAEDLRQRTNLLPPPIEDLRLHVVIDRIVRRRGGQALGDLHGAAAPDDAIGWRQPRCRIALADAFFCGRAVGGRAGHARLGPAVEVCLKVAEG